MEIVDGARNFFQSLTVLGWFLFVSSLVVFLILAAIFLIKRGGDRYAWFLVGLVSIFLGIGLRYGIPKATELLSYGIGDSLIWVPSIQESIGSAFDMAVAPWLDGGVPQPTLDITAGEVTIVATGGLPPTPVPTAIPTSTPEAPTPTLGSGVGGDGPAATLTNEEAATAIINQQLTATYTPRPPTPEPAATLDMSIWNVQTPAPTRGPGG